MRRVFFLISMLAVGGVLSLFAQLPPVRPSQYAEVKQRIGVSDVSLVYHRPGAKGRQIWGGLLPYNTVWRAGANEPTLITFSDTVWVAGSKLAPGQYRFVIFPRAQGPWTAVFNSEIKNWGTQYDSTYDVLHVNAPADAASHEEWMSFSFTDLTAHSATLLLRWEKIAVKMPLEFNTAGRLAAGARFIQTGAWQALNNQARYLLDNDGDMKEATKAADQALAVDENPTTLRTKAEVLARSGNTADAVKTMEKAIQVGKSRNPNMNTKPMDDLIKEWKSKR